MAMALASCSRPSAARAAGAAVDGGRHAEQRCRARRRYAGGWRLGPSRSPFRRGKDTATQRLATSATQSTLVTVGHVLDRAESRSARVGLAGNGSASGRGQPVDRTCGVVGDVDRTVRPATAATGLPQREPSPYWKPPPGSADCPGCRRASRRTRLRARAADAVPRTVHADQRARAVRLGQRRRSSCPAGPNVHQGSARRRQCRTVHSRRPFVCTSRMNSKIGRRLRRDCSTANPIRARGEPGHGLGRMVVDVVRMSTLPSDGLVADIVAVVHRGPHRAVRRDGEPGAVTHAGRERLGRAHRRVEPA